MMAAIFDHLWQSTLVALGAGLLAMAFRRARASVRHGLWFAASVKFLVPFTALAALGGLLAPAVPPPGAPETVFIAQAAAPFSQFYAIAPVADAAAPVVHAAAPAAHGFDPALVLLGVWGLGCAAVLILWMARWAKVRSAVRHATPLAWSAPMPVLASSSLLEPGLVGLWRPVLIVPETLPDHLAQPEIEALVAHEACHLRRRDNLTAAIHMLVEALFWFHPLVWWIGARLIDERERACDEAVVRSGHDRAAYARSLLECCRLYLRSPLSCVAGASGSNLKTRVEMIMTARPFSPLPRSRKALLLASGLCAIGSPVAAGWLASPTGQQAAARVAVIASHALAVRTGHAASDAKSSPASPPKTIAVAQNEASPIPDPVVAGTSPEPGAPSPSPAGMDVSTSPLLIANVDVSRPSLIPVSAQTPDARLLLTAAAGAPGRVPGLLTSEPVWVRLPEQTWGERDNIYPYAAEGRNLPGRAVLRCRVKDRGGLERCVVLDESPAGQGFGNSALFLARQYRLRTTAADGTPVAGHLIDVTVHFTPKYFARIVDDAGRYDYSKPPQLVRWLVQPAGYALSPAPPPIYPTEAGKVGAAAEVVLDCRVKADGLLNDCGVAKEKPQGLGFARAALLAHLSLLRVGPRALDGTPTEGRTVEVRYVMNPPCWFPADNEQRRCG